MTTLKLPTTDASTLAALHQLRGETAQMERQLAEAEAAAAARILRQLWDDAAELLTIREVSDSGASTMIPVVLLDQDGLPLWFNCRERNDLWTYPGADLISDGRGRPVYDLHIDVTYTLAEHLERAYDAVGGIHGALDGADDDFFGIDHQMLVLDIAEALGENPGPR